jgi:hypothetical protein
MCRTIGLHARVWSKSIAAADTPRHRTTPAVLFHDRDVPASLFISAVAPLIAARVAPTLLVRTFGIPALAPALTPLAFLLLRIADAELRAAVGADAELNARLSHRGRADKKTRTDCGCSQKSKFSHGFNPLA